MKKYGILIAIIIFAAFIFSMNTKDNPTNKDNFTTTLSNGVTVELIGVCDYPSKDKQWWSPNGNPLAEPPYDYEDLPNHLTREPDENQRIMEFAIKAYSPSEIDLKDTNLMWNTNKDCIPTELLTGLFLYARPKNNEEKLSQIHAVGIAYDKNQTKVNFNIAAGFGKWTTKSTCPVSELTAEKHEYKSNGYTWYKPFIKETSIRILIPEWKSDMRTIGITEDGKECEPLLSTFMLSGGSGKINKELSIDVHPVTDAKEIQFQTRPYEWIEFKDVALKPNKSIKQNPNFKVEQEPTIESENQTISGDNKVIAIVLGKEVYSKDIEPTAEMYEKNKSEMSDIEFTRWLKQYREAALRWQISTPLNQEYIKANNIKATDREMKEFNAALNHITLERNRKLEQERETPEARCLEFTKRPIKMWKMKKSLFEKYGGRVIFQPAGMEPIDAYRSFLKDQQKAGRFEIKDKQASDIFWDYYINEKHTFYTDPDKAEKVMKTPWWLMSKDEIKEGKSSTSCRSNCGRDNENFTATLSNVKKEAQVEDSQDVLPEEVIAINKVLGNWFDNCSSGNLEGVKSAWPLNHPEAGRDLKDMKELTDINYGWKFSLLSIMWDKTEAMAVSGALPKSDRKPDSPAMLVWTLKKTDQGWKLTDIDLEDLEGLQVENGRFMQSHPEAKVWFDNPDLKAAKSNKENYLQVNILSNFKSLANSLVEYAENHSNKFPEKLDLIAGKMPPETYDWAKDNIVYTGSGMWKNKWGYGIIAYEKKIVEEDLAQSGLCIFNNGDVRGISPQESIEHMLEIQSRTEPVSWNGPVLIVPYTNWEKNNETAYQLMIAERDRCMTLVAGPVLVMEKYIKQWPEMTDITKALNMLGLEYNRLGRSEDAKETLNKAIEIANNSNDAFANTIEINLAVVEADMGKYTQAEQRLKKVMSIPLPDSLKKATASNAQLFIAPQTLAELYISQGKTQEADQILKENAQKAIRLTKENPNIKWIPSYAVNAYKKRISIILNENPDNIDAVCNLIEELEQAQPNYKALVPNQDLRKQFKIPYADTKVYQLKNCIQTSSPVPQATPLAQGQKQSFGPIIEITINDAVSVKKDSLIDFDTRKLFSLPDNWIDRTTEEAMQWVTETGVDASGASRDIVKGLMCEDMIFSPVSNSYWDNTNPNSPDSLATNNLWEDGKPGRPAYMTGKGELPATYIFKTREGGIGVLQIVGFTENPRGIKIRYKLLKKDESTNRTKPCTSCRSRCGRDSEIETATPPETKPQSIETNNNFTATLSNGVTVEILGVCEHPNKDKQWWSPDGNLPVNNILEHKSMNVTPLGSNREIEVVLKYHNGIAKDIGFEWNTPQSPQVSGDGTWVIDTPEKNLREIMFQAPKELDVVNLQLGFAAKPWTSFSEFSTNGGSANGITRHAAIQQEDQTILDITYNILKMDVRIIAVDNSGLHHPNINRIGSNNSEYASYRFVFDVPLKDIKQFQFQTRPYEWVEFKNVALKPKLLSQERNITENEIFLPNIDGQTPKVLDLATGELIDVSNIRNDEELEKYLKQLGKGNLLYDHNEKVSTLVSINGVSHIGKDFAKGKYTPPHYYKIDSPPPQIFYMTDFSKTGFDYKITVISADKSGCRLKYRALTDPSIKSEVNKENCPANNDETIESENQTISDDNKVIAIILGKEVYSKDIEPTAEMYEKNKSEMSDIEFTRWLKQYREAALGRHISTPLIQEYIKANNIEATDTEIKEFNAALNHINIEPYRKWEQERDKLTKELDSQAIDQKRKSEIESKLKRLNRVLDPEVKKRSEARRLESTKRQIKMWKMKKALFEKYGGRVIFQQAGLEPIDVYRDFLEDQQKAGRFEIKDKQASDIFWDYYINEKHTFYSDQNEAEKFIKTPMWVLLKEKMEEDKTSTSEQTVN